MNFKRLSGFLIKNYLIVIILFCVVFVGIISVYRLYFTRGKYIYAKVKVGQGLWWASTAKPTSWLIRALKKGTVEKNFLGEPIMEILSITYYPAINMSNYPTFINQYDVYLTLKLKVSGSSKTGKYNFNRSVVSVASPLDLEFPSVQVSGTVIDISDKLFAEDFIEKTIVLTKKNAYPWEFDAIKINDTYFDGKRVVFEILDKKSWDTATFSQDIYKNITPLTAEPTKYIEVKARIKLTKENSQLIYGEEQIINSGKSISLSTANFTFQDYVIGQVE